MFPLVRVTTPQFMCMLSQGHPLCNSMASMGSLWLVMKLYNRPVVECNFIGEYLSFLLMKTYIWQAVAYSNPLHKVRFLHLTIKKVIIVPRDAKVTKVFIHGSRHTYLACPSWGTIGADQGSVPLRASAPSTLYRAIVATKVFSLPCLMQAYSWGPIETNTMIPVEK